MNAQRLLIVALLVLAAAPLAAQTSFFDGTVRSADFGVPLSNITVAAYNSSGFIAATTLTDSQGRYSIPLPPGTYRILAYDNAGNYAVAFYKDANSFESSEPITLASLAIVTVDFRLERAQQITGTVTDSSNGAGIGGAVVAAYNLDGTRRTFTTAGTSGNFSLVLPAGSYKLVAYHDSLAFVPKFYSEQPLFENAAIVTPPRAGIAFSLERGVKVRGTVSEAGTGQRLFGMRVAAYDLTGTVRYRSDLSLTGEFAFVLPQGNYKFAVEDERGIYETTFFKSSTTFAAAASVNLKTGTLPPSIDIEARRALSGGSTTLWVPAAANASGGSGRLQTDVWIFNPSTQETLTVFITFLRGGQDNSGATGLPVAVAPREQIALVNILDSLFHTSGTGALRLEGNLPFRVTSRTFNIPNNPEIGTFGLALPGQSIGSSLSRVTLAGLSSTTGTRTNVGLLNPQPESVKVVVELFAANGTLLGAGEVTLRPSEWVQPNIVTLVGLDVSTQIQGAYAILSSDKGSFFSYAAVVDARSGDATIILPESE